MKVLNNREREIARLLEERERLLDEERQAPHGEGVAAWVFADIASGKQERRQRQLAECERDVYLTRCGYRLTNTPIPTDIDPSGRCRYLIIFETAQLVLTITRDFIQYCLQSLSQWQQLIEGRAGAGQHHMTCKVCGEPILRYIHIDYKQLYDMFLPGEYWTPLDYEGVLRSTDPRVMAAVTRQFRAVSAGYESDPIKECPSCHVRLTDQQLEEIPLRGD